MQRADSGIKRKRAGGEAPGAQGDLSRYRQKRDFSKTPEPGGDISPRTGEALRFVI